MTISEIVNSSREELEEFRNNFLSENNLASDTLPFYVLAAIKVGPGVCPISNSMFYIVLHYIREFPRNYNYGTTTEWLDDENISAWVAIQHLADRYIFFLTPAQKEILYNSFNICDADYEEAARVLNDALETSPLTEEEKRNPIASLYQIPLNSGSTIVEERTSRFSGASWYEGIKQKVIILAGLGGIGSYVCFLLSRMQPTSLFIYDDDIVEAANMSGQLYGASDVNNFKVDAISDMVSNYAGYNSVFAIREKFTTECEATDIMICGFDNMQARKTFFESWHRHVNTKNPEEKKKCLFIDGRLSAEYLQVFSFTGDDDKAILNYSETKLFSDEEADETVCSYKQTSYMANMIGSIIVNIFTNFVANEVAGAPIRELPFFTEYDGLSMQLKIE